MSEQGGLEARLRSMEEALEQIGTSPDERQTCRELAGFLCRTLSDAAAVDLTGPGAIGPGARTERVAVAGATALLDATGAGGAALVRALDRDHPLETWTAGAGATRTYLASVPLTARGELYGRLLTSRTRGDYGDHELATLHFAARLTAIHLGHARRLAATETTALDLQRALVAEPGRPHPNLEVASRYLPAGARALVGGDWFETIRLHFGRTLLAVGDVMGHGLEAAVDMNAYRSVLREVASTDLAPHRVLRQLDSLSASDDTRRPATCLLVRIDPARSMALYASAGHLPPALFSRDGVGELIDVPVGPPLGTGVGGYEALARPITPDQTLLLYTDGLVERRSEDIETSLARLAALRLGSRTSLPEVVDAVCAGLDAQHAEDDVAVLAARLRPRLTDSA
ncbi:SpoIIE family protein phosphatase [Streptomyces sp. NBC_00335]|uniref:PP2C family protein-serine/threonine phosphatase n=1 Tax=unclassified Streptomyces TaxID=2593676 RepID=UPI00225B506D|nr:MULTISPECIES: PP2C family protein-serine/threonine phosphatase [unclassified Streptomyces]MCX5403313.1 SpoIIE family protein phosphatase [Streptomyces sp. NBC_00086]